MTYSLHHSLVTPQVSLSQQDSSPLFFIPLASLICPCGKPYFLLRQTLFTPVAYLICPCGKPRLPLWQTLFTPVAKPFFPSIYWDISSDVDLERYVSLLMRFRAGCILRIMSSKYDEAPCAQVGDFTGYSAARGLASLAI